MNNNTPTLMQSEEERAPWNQSMEELYGENNDEDEDEDV